MKISGAEIAFSGLHKPLLRALEAWRPPPLKTELEYRDALFAYLREIIPDAARVEKEYRHAGTTVDLYLRCEGLLTQFEVFFELKRHLRKKVEFDRFVGQIEGLDPQRHDIFLVLIGERDASLVARLKERYASSLEPQLFRPASMVLVEIP